MKASQLRPTNTLPYQTLRTTLKSAAADKGIAMFTKMFGIRTPSECCVESTFPLYIHFALPRYIIQYAECCRSQEWTR